MVRIGVDVGGTGIQVGVVDRENRIIREGSIPTRTDLPFEEQVRQIADCILATARDAGFSADEIESVGIGIPGIASAKTGEIIKCTNMCMNLVCQQESIENLKLLANHQQHGVLIVGDQGSGKTFLARQYSSYLGIPDFYKINPVVSFIHNKHLRFKVVIW